MVSIKELQKTLIKYGFPDSLDILELYRNYEKVSKEKQERLTVLNNSEKVEIPIVPELTRQRELLAFIRFSILEIEDLDENCLRFLDSITDKELAKNRTIRPVEIFDRVYSANTKITTLLKKLFKTDMVIDKAIGRLAEETVKFKCIMATSDPVKMITNSLNCRTCYSDEGINWIMPFLFATSKNILMCYDEKQKCRSWLTIEEETKRFTLSESYPHNSPKMAYSIISHMESLGYTIIDDLTKYYDFDLTEEFYYIDYFKNPFLSKSISVEPSMEQKSQWIQSSPVFLGKCRILGEKLATENKYSNYSMCKGCGKFCYYKELDDKGFCEECSGTICPICFCWKENCTCGGTK